MTRTTIGKWWAPRFLTTALVVAMLCLCVLVLSETMLFKEMVLAITTGRGLGEGLISVLLLLPVVVLFSLTAISSTKGMKVTLGVSWAMIVPAILSFSGLDWLAVFSPTGSGGHYIVALPDYLVIAVMVGLSAACLFQRSYAQVASIRERLRGRGIDGGEVDKATAGMFASMSCLGAAATVAAVGVFAGGSILSGLSEPDPVILAAGLAVLCAAITGLFILLRGLEGPVSTSSVK